MRTASIFTLLAIAFVSVMSIAATSGGDISAPVLVAAAADRYQIDTSKSEQTVTFTLQITDDLSGVASVYLEFRNELGYNSERACQQWPDDLMRDVTLQCPIAWPQYSAEGRWLVTYLWLRDGVGNTNSGAADVADCTTYDSGICRGYKYNELATDVIRSIEIQVGLGAPGTDPLLYLPLMAR